MWQITNHAICFNVTMTCWQRIHHYVMLHVLLFLLQVLQNRKYLAVADEEGYVSVLDTSAPPPRGLHDEGSTPAQWLAHHNAIFDLAWCKV